MRNPATGRPVRGFGSFGFACFSGPSCRSALGLANKEEPKE